MAYTLNGQSYEFAAPMLMDGTTFVPLGNVADALGGIVDWDNMTKTAAVEFGSQKVRVQADNANVETAGGMESLQAAPFIDGGTLWVPVRLFEQVLNCNIAVDGDNVQITRNF